MKCHLPKAFQEIIRHDKLPKKPHFFKNFLELGELNHNCVNQSQNYVTPLQSFTFNLASNNLKKSK